MQILEASSSSSHSDALYHIGEDFHNPPGPDIEGSSVRRLEDAHISVPQDQDRPLTSNQNAPTRPHPPQPPAFYQHPDTYPPHIFETAIHCGSGSMGDKTVFYPLWHQVLAYWFPRSAGFKIEEDWQPGFLDAGQTPISMVVLYQNQPIVLLCLEESRDHLDGLPQQKIRGEANRVFDRISVWSGQPALCVIAVMETKWSSFIRPTDMTSRMVDEMVGYDWYGDFGDEVWSLESYRAFKQYFDILKRSCTQ